jgi:hypothetical protein
MKHNKLHVVWIASLYFGDDTTALSKLFFVDLASSEKHITTYNMQEAAIINKTFKGLSEAMVASIIGIPKTRVRESTLLQIMKDCFKIDSQIELIICIVYSKLSLKETFRSL